MRYFHVQIFTPLGPTAQFVRAEHHPLHPGISAAVQTDVARLVSMQAGGQLVPKDMIVLMAVTELEEAVARARWPEDFKSLLEP